MDSAGPTNAEDPGGSISDIPPAVAKALLAGATVGRVAFIGGDGRQELMLVNFTVIRDAIHFRTSGTGPLARLAEGSDNVAVGVDGFDVSAKRGWNVTARGESSRVTDADVLRELAASGLGQPWAGGDRNEIVRITIREIDGRRVASLPPNVHPEA